ncbi:MAG: hypothetical protein ACR2JW_15270 [Thermomicrobiales bacterium]
MAVKAAFFSSDGVVALDLHLDQQHERVASAPDSDFAPGSLLWFYWDEEKLARGEHEFLGIEVSEIRSLRDEDIEYIRAMPLPRIDLPEAGLSDVTVADVLQWAKHYDGRSRAQPDRRHVAAT